MYSLLLRNFLAGNPLELINFVVRWKITTDFPQLTIHQPLATIMKNKNYIGLGIALGAGIGSGIGAAMGNLGMGIGIGVGIGLAIGAGLSQKKKNKEDKKDNTGE